MPSTVTSTHEAMPGLPRHAYTIIKPKGSILAAIMKLHARMHVAAFCLLPGELYLLLYPIPSSLPRITSKHIPSNGGRMINITGNALLHFSMITVKDQNVLWCCNTLRRFLRAYPQLPMKHMMKKNITRHT